MIVPEGTMFLIAYEDARLRKIRREKGDRTLKPICMLASF